MNPDSHCRELFSKKMLISRNSYRLFERTQIGSYWLLKSFYVKSCLSFKFKGFHNVIDFLSWDPWLWTIRDLISEFCGFNSVGPVGSGLLVSGNLMWSHDAYDWFSRDKRLKNIFDPDSKWISRQKASRDNIRLLDQKLSPLFWTEIQFVIFQRRRKSQSSSCGSTKWILIPSNDVNDTLTDWNMNLFLRKKEWTNST